MRLESLLKKTESFYKLAIANHYPVDMSKATNILKMYQEPNNDKETMEYALVPISEIEKRPIWSPEKLQTVKKQLQEGKSLEPVMLIKSPEKPGKLLINDGIHRIEASLQLGYTQVPALIHTYY